MLEQICPRCRNRLPAQAKFCARCGSAVPQTPIPPTSQWNPAPRRPQWNSYSGTPYGRRRKPGGIFAIIFFAFIFLHVMRGCSFGSPNLHMMRGPTMYYPSPQPWGYHGQ